jgi:hypothetical protein
MTHPRRKVGSSEQQRWLEDVVPFFADVHRFVGDNGRGEHLCRSHKSQPWHDQLYRSAIKGGSGSDTIGNDAKNGIVTVGNGSIDEITLGGAGAKATLGNGVGDSVFVGLSALGTTEAAGSALGDSVKFNGSGATAELFLKSSAEAGSTAGTTSIGLTKVHNAAAGLHIDISAITGSSNIVDETAKVASSTNLTAAENAAVKTMNSAGVAYFTFHGSEYFVATNNAELAVSSHDAIVELVGITGIHNAHTSGGVVTLA